MKLLLLKTKLKSTDDRAWWPVKAPLGAIDNQLRRINMSDYEEARIAWMEDNNGSTVGFAEAYGPRTKEDIIAERVEWDDDDEYQNEQWD